LSKTKGVKNNNRRERERNSPVRTDELNKMSKDTIKDPN